MSTQTKVTKGVRVRRAGKTGEWLIARHTKSGKLATQSQPIAKEPLPPLGRHRPRAAAAEKLPLIRELMSAGDLETHEEDVLVVSSSDPATLEKARALIELMSTRLSDLADADMAKLIDAAMPTLSDRPSPAVIDQARRNAEARAEFIRSYEMVDAEQVHEMFGSSAKNRAALAARWRADDKIFALEHQGRLLYPAFQFNSQGRPKPIIGQVLTALGNAVGPWQMAIWFTNSNAWLDGRKPVDLLDTDAAAVLDAAADIAEPIVH